MIERRAFDESLYVVLLHKIFKQVHNLQMLIEINLRYLLALKEFMLPPQI